MQHALPVVGGDPEQEGWLVVLGRGVPPPQGHAGGMAGAHLHMQ